MVRSTAMFVALVPEGIGVVVGSGSTAITTVTTLVIVTVAAEDADVGVLLSASVVEGAPLLLDAEEKVNCKSLKIASRLLTRFI